MIKENDLEVRQFESSSDSGEEDDSNDHTCHNIPSVKLDNDNVLSSAALVQRDDTALAGNRYVCED